MGSGVIYHIVVPSSRSALQLIQVSSLSAEIVRALQRAIIAGEYAPGERLVERDLAAQFGVSSIPVREALQELESRGLVVRRPNRGCSVVELSEDEITAIWNLRRVLEPAVIQWAAERFTPDDAPRLKEQLARLEQAVEAGDFADFFYQDLLLHRLIWSISGNRFAERALESAIGSLFASGLRQRESLDLKRELAKHRALVDALAARSAGRAAEILLDIAGGFQRHLEKSRGRR
jgi:DNA-binding GntR family transcriptional regulator